MQKVTDIKNRIKSISDTRKITGAMETISVAKMQKAMVKYASTKLFVTKVQETINDTVCQSHDSENIYYNSNPKCNKSMHIVISSDKGMAGAYNSNVIKDAHETIKTQKECIVYPIGHTARNYFEHNDCSVCLDYVGMSYSASKRDAEIIQKDIVSLFKKGEISSVYISYTHMNENSSVNPITIKLLPFCYDTACNCSKSRSNSKSQILEFDPSVEEVLEVLVPKYLQWIIYGAMVLSQASEHYSRRLAMSNATKNADEILSDLNIKYNQARQESITNELIEIVTTTAGVSGRSGGQKLGK